MTPQQEQKLDQVFEICLRTEGNFNLANQILGQHRDAILDQEKAIIANKKDANARIAILEADKNKVLGAMWVACSSAFLGLLSFIGSVWRK